MMIMKMLIPHFLQYSSMHYVTLLLVHPRSLMHYIYSICTKSYIPIYLIFNRLTNCSEFNSLVDIEILLWNLYMLKKKINSLTTCIYLYTNIGNTMLNSEN